MATQLKPPKRNGCLMPPRSKEIVGPNASIKYNKEKLA
jgi:hypothetical protein